MHTIKLKMEDNIYKNIMFILQNLKLKGLEIEEIHEDTATTNTKTKMKEEFLDFSQYKVKAFQSIEDPVKWQEKIRDEWS